MRKKSWISIKEDQEFRYKRFPKDRIAFLNTVRAVENDQNNFKAYKDGEITLKMLCIRTAMNNYLPDVSEEAMLNELRITGWLKE